MSFSNKDLEFLILEGKVLIRKAKRSDIKEIIPLLNQLWLDVQLDIKNIEAIFNEYVQNVNYKMYFSSEGEIQGLITISLRDSFFYGGKVAIIEDLVVDEKYRGRDIGRKLVEFVEKELRGKGIRAIELSSDLHRDRAHGFWEKMGYMKSAYQFRKIISNG